MARETIPGYVRVDTLDAALALLDEWIAYAMRLEVEHDKASSRAEHLADLLHHLDPFLPETMQDAKEREAAPGVYRNVAAFLRGEESPDPEGTTHSKWDA